MIHGLTDVDHCAKQIGVHGLKRKMPFHLKGIRMAHLEADQLLQKCSAFFFSHEDEHRVPDQPTRLEN